MILKRRIIASIISAAMIFSIIQPGIVLAAETTESDSEPAEAVITVDGSETDESTIDISVDETDPSEDVDTTETSEVPEETEPPVSEPSETEPAETVEPTLPEETTEPSEDLEPTATPTVEPTVTPTIAPTATATVTPTNTPTATPSPTPVPLEAFDQSKTIDGIEVRVIAEPGVFPPGSTLSVTKIDNMTIDDFASIDRSNFIISESILFDITILDADGNEIEPDGDVKVQFYDTRFSDENLEATIYHIEDVNEVVELDYTYVDDNGNTTTQASDIIEAETNSFSYYTVEFTYAEKQYVLDGGASVSISTILEAVGLAGTPTSIEVSNTNLLSVSNNNIRALKAFTTEEWIKVTINDVEYTIIVTDEVDDTGVATAGEDLYAVLYDSGKLVFQKGEDAREAYGNITQSWAVTPSFSSGCPWAEYNSSITSIVFNNPTEGITVLNGYFSGCSNLTEIVNIDKLDTSKVTTMGSMFSGCSSLTSLDLSSFDTSKCTNMGGMLSGCASLQTLNIDNFDFSAVSSIGMPLSSCIGGMFGGSTNISNLSAKNWTNVPANISHLFGRSCSLSANCTLDVSGWDTSAVTDMCGVFASCQGNVLGYNTWNTSNVTDMSQLFNGCPRITSVDLSSFDFSKVTNVNAMFAGASSLTTIILPSSFSRVSISSSNNIGVSRAWLKEGSSDIYEAVDITTGGTYTYYSDGAVTAQVGWDAYAILYSDGTLVFQKGSSAETTHGSPEYTWNLDETNHPWTAEDIRDSITSVVFRDNIIGKTSTGWMFADCSNITSISNADRLDMSAVTDTYCMFYHCASLTSIGTTNWDLSNATNVEWMFQGCSSLTAIDTENWTMSNKTTNFYNMFSGCSSLTSLDLSSFDFSNASTYIYMLYNFSGNTITIPSSFSSISDNGATKLTGNWISGDNAVRGTEIESASAGTYTRVESATLGNNVYGILYEDGTLVVQKGNTPDPARGTVVSSGKASTSNTGMYAWGAGYSYISTIKKVVFTVECSVAPNRASGMFNNYSSLESIENLFLVNFGNNPNFSSFWGSCSSLEEIDFTQLTFTGNINNIYYALYGCTNVKRIIYPSNVTVSSNIDVFAGSSNNTIYVTASDDPTSAFDFKTVLNSYGDTADVYTVVNKVSFYLNGGSMTGPAVRYSNENGLIDGNQFYTPTRTNYTFDGWYDTDGNRYEEYPAGETIDSFYARWTANTYTITFDPNGRFGLDPVVVEVPYDESVPLSDVFADENTGNWYVKNWNTKATGVGSSYSINYRVCNFAGQENNITIYAQWSEDVPVNMTIKYIDLKTGEEVHESEQITVSATRTFTQAGIDLYKTWDYDYVQFLSFTPDLDYVHSPVTETSGTPENGYHYSYTYDGQTYYYNYYNNSIQNSTVVNAEMDGATIYAYVLPKIAIRINFPAEVLEFFPDLSFTLDGESYRSGEYIIYTEHSTSKGNSYSFEYYNLPANYFGFGTYSFQNQANYMVNNGTFDNNLFGWKGYSYAHTHDNFYTSYEYTGEWNGRHPYSYTYYSYADDYYLNGVGLYDNDYVDYYYDLLAYIYIDANGGVATNNSDSYLNDGTLYRYSTYIGSGANGYDLSDYNWWSNFFKNEPTEEQNNNCSFTSFTRPGYTYAGLWTEPDGGEQVVYEQIGTNYYSRKINLLTTPVLYVHWVEEEVPTETVTIAFDSQGGSEIEPVTVFKGYPLSSVTNDRLAPTYLNKTFIGWYTEPNGQGTALEYNTPINDDITYYAYWVDTTRFTLTYDANGGQIRWYTGSSNYGTTRQTSIYAGPIEHEYIAYLENNLFIGWFTEPDGGVQIKNGDVVTPDITTLYAHYTPMIGDVNDDNFVYTYYANWTGYDPYKVLHDQQSNATDTLHLRFAVNESSDTLPAGTVRIRIPYAIGLYGYANLGNIPRYPTDASSSGMFFSYEEHLFYDDVTDEVDYDRSYYEIINVAPLQGGFGIDANISYYTPLYQMYGGDIVNGAYSNGRTHFTDKMVPILFYVDTDLDGDLETSAEVDLEFEVHHTFDLTSSSYVSGTGYMFWQDSWGERPADADDYMYAVWTGTAYLSGQGVQGRVWMDEGSSPDGEFVKYLTNGATNATISGSNSRQSSGSVLYRYPKALLYVAEDERYTASYTTNINAYTRDAFTKSRSVSNTCDIKWRYISHDEAEFEISRVNSRDQNTQRNLTQWGTPEKAQWQIRYHDTAPYTIITNPDGSRSMNAESMTVSIGQSSSDFIYSSGAGQNFSRWFSPSGNIHMTEDEVTFSSIEINVTAYDATYVDENDSITFAYKEARNGPFYADIYVRYRGSDELVFYKTVEINTYNNWFNLPTSPAPVVEYEVRYNTNGAYYTTMSVKPNVQYSFYANQYRLRNYVISDYNADVTSIFKADFRGRVTDSQGDWAEVSMEYTRNSAGDVTQVSPTASATYILYEYSKVKVNEYELLKVDANSYVEDLTTQSSSITAGAVFSNVTTDYSQQKTGITSGTFYFLIPDHVSVSNVQVRSGGSSSTSPSFYSGNLLSSEYWTVSYTNNWNNSGYTLMQVDIAQNTTDRNLVAVSFKMTRTFAEVEQWGHLDTLRGMFYNTSDTLINNPTSRTYTYANARSIAAAFNGIYNNSMESRTLFDNASVAFKAPEATAWGISSTVANSADLPSDHAYVFPGEDYTYRIMYNQSEEKRAYKLRFEDQLDGMGYLTAVEAPVLSGIDELGNEVTCTPVIWYSVDENPDYEHIDTDHGWTTTKPEDVIVYGLSIDYTTADNGNEFRLPGKELIGITLRMHNGSYFEAIDHTNTAIAYTADYTSVDPDTITAINTTTTVTLELPDLAVAKSSDPESGTEAEPALVLFESDITYTISVTNNEDRQIQNVVVRDILDQNLTYNVSGITIGGMTLDQSVKADLLTNDNNLLEIKIHALEAGETLNIQIKTSIASAHGSDPNTGRCVVTNEAYLVAYNDVRLEKQAKYTSNMTYHEFYVFPDATGLNIEVTAYIAVFTLCACLYVVSKHKKHRYNR